jgi:hypothetical protein
MPAEILQEIDNNFIGINSRLDPSNLQPGFAQSSSNVRMQRGIAQPRKGSKRMLEPSLDGLTMSGSSVFVNSIGEDNIVMYFTDRMYMYNTETNAFLGPYLYPTSRQIAFGDHIDAVQCLGDIYIFRGKETEKRYGTGGTASTAAVELVHSQVLPGASVTVTATWTIANPPTYVAGDEITIFNVIDSQHPYLNNNYVITSVFSNSFTFTFKNTTSSTIVASTTGVYGCTVKVKPPFVWSSATSDVSICNQTSIPNNVQPQSGFTVAEGAVPAADFGFYFQNRLICKISDTQLAVSDILSNVFDYMVNNFIINQGGNDEIIGVLPWIENQFLIFMQRSIYIAYVEPTAYIVGTNVSPGSAITVLTTQVGCLSRKSIVSAGQYVLFVSGKGVNILTPQLDLKLIGNSLPLSEPIDNFFDEVNFNTISTCNAAYYDNRFFIAFPTEGYSRPTKILVYNTLNQAWETIDTYPQGMYIDNFYVCQYGNKRRLFIVTNYNGSNDSGGIFLTEEIDAGDEFSNASGSPTLPFVLPAVLESTGYARQAIDAKIRSREYTFGNSDSKIFTRASYQFNNVNEDNIKIYATTHDPDSSEYIIEYTFSGSSNGDSTLRPRIATRGASIDIEVQFIKGRCALKSALIYAISANRSMVSEE